MDVEEQKKSEVGGLLVGGWLGGGDRECLRRRYCCRRLHSRKIDPPTSQKEIYEAVT